MRWQAYQYLPSAAHTTQPYATPLMAKDLSNLPPALIILAEKDELREMGQIYADKLMDAGVPTQVYCQQGIGHLPVMEQELLSAQEIHWMW